MQKELLVGGIIFLLEVQKGNRFWLSGEGLHGYTRKAGLGVKRHNLDCLIDEADSQESAALSTLWHLTYVNTCYFTLIDNALLLIEFSSDFIKFKVDYLVAFDADSNLA